MYVQIDDKIQKQLESANICSMMMGSHAHSLANSDSDLDVLYIYQEKESTLYSSRKIGFCSLSEFSCSSNFAET